MAASLVRRNLKKYRKIGGLVVVESGGPHSIAIATKLAEAGYQPIIKMGLSTRDVNKSWVQEVGAMKFYASRMEQAKAKLHADSPVAIIMDVHRNEIDWHAKDPFQQITPDYQSSSFPTSQEVKDRYSGAVIWVTEFPRGLRPRRFGT